MQYLATFGGIILTFLAGTEIDTGVMKESFKESFLIGGFSFLIPFAAVGLLSHFLLHWDIRASLIAGIALSLSVIFIKPTFYTALFYTVSIIIILVASRFS